jgi:myo-inositol-1(or 4)-monophosphatase
LEFDFINCIENFGCYTHVMNSTLQFASKLARDTGQLLLEFFNPGGSFTSLKEDFSVVTEADLSADQMITESIQKSYPQDSLISEELQPKIGKASAGIWVVDPLDGTTNFSLGLPIWGVSIARLVDGWPEIGVVYFPFFNEIFTAARGAGAYMNSEQIHSQPPLPGQTTSFFSCCTRTHQQYEVSIRYKTRILGSSCFSLCAVARGMAVVAFEATPKIWDIAAGWIIATEAGAPIDTLDGPKPFPLKDNFDYRSRSFPVICAANQELLSNSRTQIKPRMLLS